MAASKSVILAAFICVACAANASTDARAQVRMELTPTTEIPRSYKSWSLFLICNPAWIVENGDKGIEELFDRYKAFGEAIGPNNLAIWFWKKPDVAPTSDSTDVSRSAVYCEKYKLLPSESPHVLVTTQHPDDQDPGDRFVVSLNGLDAHRDHEAGRPACRHRIEPVGPRQQRSVAARSCRNHHCNQRGVVLFQQGFVPIQNRRGRRGNWALIGRPRGAEYRALRGCGRQTKRRM